LPRIQEQTIQRPQEKGQKNTDLQLTYTWSTLTLLKTEAKFDIYEFIKKGMKTPKG